METSIMLARLLGYYCLIMGIALVVNKKTYQSFLAQMPNNHSNMVLTGIMSLILGLLIVCFHNVWSGWPILITVVGYLAVLKGIFRLYFTPVCARYSATFELNRKYYTMTAITFIMAGLFIYFAYWGA